MKPEINKKSETLCSNPYVITKQDLMVEECLKLHIYSERRMDRLSKRCIINRVITHSTENIERILRTFDSSRLEKYMNIQHKLNDYLKKCENKYFPEENPVYRNNYWERRAVHTLVQYDVRPVPQRSRRKVEDVHFFHFYTPNEWELKIENCLKLDILAERRGRRLGFIDAPKMRDVEDALREASHIELEGHIKFHEDFDQKLTKHEKKFFPKEFREIDYTPFEPMKGLRDFLKNKISYSKEIILSEIKRHANKSNKFSNDSEE
ncbi:hypothetical protein GCK72_008958 [Caenorhabditis remanei]|uniref:Uncharacterized protein n=1 Tax=Caenorhabditis remanei TaxID=31234 RepID=A0A6A5H129_CAERE|nr:hypothetical protein GCK72_008958 [Caenorhabditis remanei]KAF1760709.1 hypothetical protein GCK72_008958 [Caenorhabditis remanei]